MRHDEYLNGILNQNLGLATQLELFFGEIQSFFLSVASEHVFPRTRDFSGSKKKVLIITTSGFGGGHFTAGHALQSYIRENFEQISVSLIDTKTFQPEKDVFYRATGEFHSESIYDEILVKNGDQEKALAYWNVLASLKYFIPDRSVETLVDEITMQKPDLLISLIHNRPEYIMLSYAFDIPLRIVSTDYELQNLLYKYVQTGDPKLLRFLAATENPRFFDGLFNFISAPKMRGFFADIIEKAVSYYVSGYIDWSEFKQKVGIMDVLGIPVREDIQENRSPAFLDEIRAKYALPRDSKVLTIAMGRQGGSSVSGIVSEMLAERNTFEERVDLFVMCGNNQSLATKMTELVKSAEGSHLNFHILGLLGPKEVNELYNLSHFVISKPGGVTAAEMIQTNTPLLAYSYFPWERANLKLLSTIGLGFEPKMYGGLVPAVHSLLSEARKTNLSALAEDWRVNMRRLLHDVL